MFTGAMSPNADLRRAILALARELARRGEVEISRRGEVLDPDVPWRGPVRIRAR